MSSHNNDEKTEYAPLITTKPKHHQSSNNDLESLHPQSPSDNDSSIVQYPSCCLPAAPLIFILTLIPIALLAPIFSSNIKKLDPFSSEESQFYSLLLVGSILLIISTAVGSWSEQRLHDAHYERFSLPPARPPFPWKIIFARLCLSLALGSLCFVCLGSVGFVVVVGWKDGWFKGL